ncbi:uncharacterized protein LOC101738653 isoform X1 [Bombyx mori]|uniref:uncharacterized protein LOC101738653 isoform X1 n=1 Tax=Bombyx mori TaxID=7091 RepID=UPI002ED28A84
MNERKILLFLLSVVIYCMYSMQMWLMKNDVQSIEKPDEIINAASIDLRKNVTQLKREKKKGVPLQFKNACSILQIFTEKPEIEYKNKKDKTYDENSIAVIGLIAFLAILLLNAIVDVIKVKEEERKKQKLNKDGERRQSLAEFANKKTLRRESSKFSLQLFQIAESLVGNGEEKKTRRQNRPYTRGESTNSYLSEKKTHTDVSASASIGETSLVEPRLVKRKSVAKLFGGRPVPMVRRSSFPALPLNPEIQALMLGNRQSSVDSDDEGEGKGRRVRLIRRY